VLNQLTFGVVVIIKWHGIGEVEAWAQAAAGSAGAVPARWQAAGRRAKAEGDACGAAPPARPDFKPYHALHVVVRVVPAVGSLRRRKLYKAMRDATITAALREWFRIVHISLQRNHVHLLIEAQDKAALSRGMQGFLISAARHINTALGEGARRRRGKVWPIRETYDPLMVRRPQSWLLREGWKQGGGTISARDVPSKPR
jgi:REP element-mobilizing transposase RayT